MDDGELFPPSPQSGTFLDQYLLQETHIDHQLQLKDFENSLCWQEIIKSDDKLNNIEKLPLEDFEAEMKTFEDNFDSVDGKGLLGSRITDPDGYFRRRELERIKQTTALAREILEEVLEKCSLQIKIGFLLDEIIEDALKAVLRKHSVTSVSPLESSDPSDVLTPQTDGSDREDSLGLFVRFSSQASQEDMFSSQASSLGEQWPEVGERRKSPEPHMQSCGDQREDVTKGRFGQLVPYTPSSGESTDTSDVEQGDSRICDVTSQTEQEEEGGDTFDMVRLPEEHFSLLPTELQDESIQFCVKAKQMNIKVQRLSASDDSFQTVSSGELSSQESVLTKAGDSKENKFSIEIPVDMCLEEINETKTETTSMSDENTEELDLPRRICQRYEFLPNHTEDFVKDSVVQELGFKPVTTFVMKRKKMKSGRSAGLVKRKVTPMKYVLIQNWLIENEDFVVLLEKSKELLINRLPDTRLAAHILVGPVTGIFLVNDLRHVSLADIYSCCSPSLTELWLLSLGSYEVYMQCTGFSYEKASQKGDGGCRVFALRLNDDIESIAKWVIQLARRQRHEEILPHLREGTSRHETMMGIFPSLNPLSAKVILSKVTFLDFLRLSSSELSSQFPWLPESSIRSIQQVVSVRFKSERGRW